VWAPGGSKIIENINQVLVSNKEKTRVHHDGKMSGWHWSFRPYHVPCSCSCLPFSPRELLHHRGEKPLTQSESRLDNNHSQPGISCQNKSPKFSQTWLDLEFLIWRHISFVIDLSVKISINFICAFFVIDYDVFFNTIWQDIQIVTRFKYTLRPITIKNNNNRQVLCSALFMALPNNGLWT
jgi:hypothetical protein